MRPGHVNADSVSKDPFLLGCKSRSSKNPGYLLLFLSYTNLVAKIRLKMKRMLAGKSLENNPFWYQSFKRGTICHDQPDWYAESSIEIRACPMSFKKSQDAYFVFNATWEEFRIFSITGLYHRQLVMKILLRNSMSPIVCYYMHVSFIHSSRKIWAQQGKSETWLYWFCISWDEGEFPMGTTVFLCGHWATTHILFLLLFCREEEDIQYQIVMDNFGGQQKWSNGSTVQYVL